jgi:DNA-binding MarR family transcriptional regulator
LADTLLLERTSLTRNLNVLERNGWVELQTGEEDLRQRVVSLSKKGYEQLDQAIPYWKKAQKAIANEMGQDTITGLKKTLNEMTEILSE